MRKNIIVSLMIAAVAAFSFAFAATMTFSDVPSNHWAASAVSWNAEAGVMTGPGEMPGMFDPAGAVNRAQLAQVNQRMYLKLHNEIEALRDEMDGSTQETEESEETEEEMFSFEAMLDGASEVPAVVTDAEGTFSAELVGNTLTYEVSVEGLSGAVTAAHFHEAAVGVDGSPVEDVTFDGMMAEGTWVMTQEEMDKLMDGMYYLNVHTAANPEGEIRGQVMEVL